MTGESVRFGRYTVELSNQDKVLFPDAGITKGDLCSYYGDIAETMLPHVRERPLTLQRFPDGIDEDGFYQKDASEHFPDWIHTVQVPKKEGGSNRQVLADNAATLVYLANQGTVTLHVWPARADELRCPDRLVLDLDPPGDDFDVVKDAARDVREILEELGLSPFVMTTGSRGLHVTAALRPATGFDAVFDFANGVARLVAERRPDAYTTEFRKNKRRGRLFLDTRRNLYAQTSVAPYSVRPREGAPVATPLDWEELDSDELGPRSWDLHSVRRRLQQQADPWSGMGRHARGVGKAAEKLRRRLRELDEDDGSDEE